MLNQMFLVIDADLAATRSDIRPIHVFLGDYVDRGPDTRATVDLLIERSRHHETIFLKGNHEALLMDVVKDPLSVGDWLQFGGLQTLISYGLKPSRHATDAEQIDLAMEFAKMLPAAHWRFFQSLQPSFTCGDFFFAHAGVRPGVPLAEQHERDLLWIREEFLASNDDFGKFIVHGHTPVVKPDFRRYRLNIDTGAYATGNLTLLTIQDQRILTF